jgi:orotidine-5'-phosphate decarboxylase
MTANNAIDRLIKAIERKNNPSAVGLDTVADYLPNAGSIKTLQDAAKYILDFNLGIIDSVCDIVPAVKIQSACYEMYGAEGLIALRDTINYARQKGLIVICDVKRNDIGSSAGFYSAAYLGGTSLAGSTLPPPFDSDFITVNAYLGEDGIKPFTEDCAKYGKGIFVLVKTSNKGSGQLQDKTFTSGETLYQTVGGLVGEWGKDLIGGYGYSSVGAVVGATHKEQAALLRKRLKSVFFLIPGYGAQGATAQDLAVCFDESGRGGIVNSSRGILCAYKSPKYNGLKFAEAARRAAEDMKEDLTSAIKAEIQLGRL